MGFFSFPPLFSFFLLTVWCVSMASRVHSEASEEARGGSGAASRRWERILSPPPPEAEAELEEEEEDAEAEAAKRRCLAASLPPRQLQLQLPPLPPSASPWRRAGAWAGRSPSWPRPPPRSLSPCGSRRPVDEEGKKEKGKGLTKERRGRLFAAGFDEAGSSPPTMKVNVKRERNNSSFFLSSFFIPHT